MTRTPRHSCVTAICSPAGGVGRTTLTVYLSIALARLGQRVLVLDLDPGTYATRVIAGDRDADDGGARLAEAIARWQWPRAVETPHGVDVLAGGHRLEQQLHVALGDPVGVLIEMLREDYDHVLIDTTKALSATWTRALHRCDQVLLPLTCDHMVLEKTACFHDDLAQMAHAHGSTHPTIAGCVLMNAHDHTHDFIAEVDAHPRLRLLRPIIPANERLKRLGPDRDPTHLLAADLRERFDALARHVMGPDGRDT